MPLDLKYYSETTISEAKKLNNITVNKDNYFNEKYDVLKLIESKYKNEKIYYSNSFNSFLIIFKTDKDESEIFTFLGKLKKGYNGLELDLNIENLDKETKKYILKIEYSSK